MLVPAIAFAWWVVSMAPPAHGAADRSAPTARASADTDDTDSADDTAYDAPAPAAPAAPPSDDTDDDGSQYDAEKRVAVKIVTPEIVRAARSFLKELQDLPLGAERSAMLSGKRYAFVLERHYHPLDFVGGPRGWHKGVTVYEYR